MLVPRRFDKHRIPRDEILLAYLPNRRCRNKLTSFLTLATHPQQMQNVPCPHRQLYLWHPHDILINPRFQYLGMQFVVGQPVWGSWIIA
jgi:hypothetical protein